MKNRRPRTATPPVRRPEPSRVPPRVVALLAADLERAQQSPEWTAEAPAESWPPAVDDFFYAA